MTDQLTPMTVRIIDGEVYIPATGMIDYLRHTAAKINAASDDIRKPDIQRLALAASSEILTGIADEIDVKSIMSASDIAPSDSEETG